MVRRVSFGSSLIFLERFWQRLDRETYAKMPPEQLVVLSRKALRIYDACQTGDVEDAKGLFERLVKLIK